MPRPLIIEIFGNAKQFGAELDKAAGKTRQFGRVAGVAGLAIAGGLAYGLEKSVKAALEAQQSTARLDQAFKNVGLSAETSAASIDAAEASGRKLGFTDDQTRAALGSLIVATKNVHGAMTDLSVAQDLARFKGVGLSDATKMLTMAMTGSQRAVKQLGIIVPPVTSHLDALKASSVDLTSEQGKLEVAHAKVLDKMATGQAIIAATSAKVSGQGQAFAGTAAGGMEQFHAQTVHLEETLGRGLLPALASVTSALSTGAAFLASHTTVTKIAIVVLGTLAAGLMAVSVATRIVAASEVVMTAAQWLLNAALAANPIVLIVAGLVALAAGLVLAWQHSQTFRDIVMGVWNVVKVVVMGAAHAISGAIGGIIGAFQTVIGVLKDIIGFASAAFDAIKSVFDLQSTPAPGLPPSIPGRGLLPPPKRIPRYASGGVVGGPLGSPQLAVVHGGETVIPVGGRGGVLVIHSHTYLDGREIMVNTQKHAVADLRNGGFGVPGVVLA